VAAIPDAVKLATDHLAKDGGFDIVVINMAIMDIATLEPLAAALPKLLKKDGVYVVPIELSMGFRV
jgi:hypothetical protein